MSAADIDDDDDKWLARVRSQSVQQRNDALCKAARTGAIWRLETLLEYGADINHDQGRALLAAAAGSQHAAVECLIARGIQLTQETLDSALGEAAAANDPSLVKRFLGLGANAAADQSSALRLALPLGNAGVFRDLLAAGADPNAQSGHFLCITIAHGHSDAALLLLAYGADPAVYYRDMDALEWSISIGLRAVADDIRSGKTGIAASRDYFTSRDLDTLRAPQALYGGQTGLHLAARGGHFDVIRDKYLQAAKPLTTEDLMQKTPAGQSVLLLIAQSGQLGCVFDPGLWQGRQDEASALYHQHLPAAFRADIDFTRFTAGSDHLKLQEKARQFKPRAPKP